MKKILLTTILSGSALAVFGQGSVIFENDNNSGIPGICLNHLGTTYAAPVGNPGFGVALLWYNGSSYQIIDNFQSAADFPGSFNAGTATVPTYSATGTFEVQGWYNPGGNYASYAAAAAANGSYLGITSSFTAAEAMSPAQASSITEPQGGWSGNLVLQVPEPSTIALGGLGAATLLLFRRRKSGP